MSSRLLSSARHERPAYFLMAVLAKFVSQVLGRGHARLLGWRGGYLGRSSKVLGSAHIAVGISAYVNRYAWIEAVHSFRAQSFSPVLTLGDRFSCAERVHISCVSSVTVGNDCLFGSGVYISDHNHGAYHGPYQSMPLQAPVDRELRYSGAVRIGSNVWLGDNVVIVGPVSIGDGAIIGANSVVKQNVPANVIAAGAPLKLLKQFNFENGTWDRYES